VNGYRTDHIGLNVADLDVAVTWYCSALGLAEEFRFSFPEIEFEGVMLVSPAGDRLELLTRPGAGPGIQAKVPVDAALTLGFSHFALRVDDVQAMFAELIGAGAQERLSPRPGPEGGMPMAFVADPEGNLIELLSRG
jgi:lactoylglutathione lyase